jgi:hypothetical protein
MTIPLEVPVVPGVKTRKLALLAATADETGWLGGIEEFHNRLVDLDDIFIDAMEQSTTVALVSATMAWRRADVRQGPSQRMHHLPSARRGWKQPPKPTSGSRLAQWLQGQHQHAVVLTQVFPHNG